MDWDNLKIGNMLCCQDIEGTPWFCIVTDKFEQTWAFGHSTYYTFHWNDGEIETVESKILSTHYHVLEVVS